MELFRNRLKPRSSRTARVDVGDVDSRWQEEVFVAKRDADSTELVVPTVAGERSVARGRDRVARVSCRRHGSNRTEVDIR